MQVYCDIPDDQETWKRSKRVAEDQTMKAGAADTKGAAAGKRNRSALVDVTNRGITTRSSARAAQDKALQCGGSDHMQIESSDRWAQTRDQVHSMMLSPGISPEITDAVIGINLSSGGRTGVQENVCASRGDFEQDLARANDPQYCVDYVADIMDNLIQSETKLMPSSTYMDTVQHDINPTMRGILVDWLVEVAEEYKLSSENLYLSTNFADRFLSVMPVMRGKLQLVGVTCMLIASKYEEIFAPQVDDFVYITDGTYSSHEVLHMESVVLNALRFSLTAVTPHTFLRRLTSLMSFPDQLRHLCEYLCEITIQEYAYIKYRPSQIAVNPFKSFSLDAAAQGYPHLLPLSAGTGGSAAKLVLKSMHTVWQLLRCMDKWKMRVEQVVPCCRALHATHLRITDKTRTLQASWEKYSHSKWSRVSLIQPNRAVPFNS